MALKMDEEELLWFNETNETGTSFSEPDSCNVLLSLTYGVIFVTGILGNIMTCIVIVRNRSMHTDTNLYLFNLAIVDLFFLICGLPLKVYRLWKPFSYSLLESLCITLGLISEITANATILTIIALTFERYIAICCPFISHKTFNLSKTVIYNIVIWACTLCSAVPQAMQFGIITYKENRQIVGECTVIEYRAHRILAVYNFCLFIISMSLITVLYVLIGVKLHTSRFLHPVENSSIESGDRVDDTPRYRRGDSQRKVIWMLVAVTLSFFLCWAPFYVQRLITIYGKNLDNPTDFYKVYEVLSTVLYFLSTSINPFLYYIMSNKFRDAFKATLSLWFTRRERYRLERTYSAVLEERRKRAAAIASQRPHNRRMRRRLSTTVSTTATVSSQQSVAPPRAQATSRLEKNDGALLEEQKKDAAARAPRCPHNPRMLRYFAAATCQQCAATSRAQNRSRLDHNRSTLLEAQWNDAVARESQWSHNQRNRRHFETTTCQQCVAPPQTQARSRLENNHNAFLEEQRMDAAATTPQRPHNHQHRVAPLRAQSLNRSNLNIVIEESESIERQRLAQRADFMTSSQSISNSSLREVDLELSCEELVTFLYQINCNILGETRNTSV